MQSYSRIASHPPHELLSAVALDTEDAAEPADAEVDQYSDHGESLFAHHWVSISIS
jgi:hypothetical protein